MTNLYSDFARSIHTGYGAFKMGLKPQYVAKFNTLVPESLARRTYQHRLPNGDCFYSFGKCENVVYAVNYSAHYRMLWRSITSTFSAWKRELVSGVKKILTKND